MVLKFPADTIVLAITTHGAITEEKGALKTIPVPTGMTVTKMSVVPPGTCNYASAADTAKVVRLLSKEFGDETSTRTYEERAAKVFPALKHIQAEVSNRVFLDQTNKTSSWFDFTSRIDTFNTLQTYTEGMPIIDKIFEKLPGEGSDDPFDFKMPILNVKGEPDFIQLMLDKRLGVPTRSMDPLGYKGVTLEYILDYLNAQNVKHVILFDYSCAQFEGSPELTEAAKRRKLNGGKKTRRKKKTETKTRKRPVVNGPPKAHTRSLFRY